MLSIIASSLDCFIFDLMVHLCEVVLNSVGRVNLLDVVQSVVLCFYDWLSHRNYWFNCGTITLLASGKHCWV